MGVFQVFLNCTNGTKESHAVLAAAKSPVSDTFIYELCIFRDDSFVSEKPFRPVLVIFLGGNCSRTLTNFLVVFKKIIVLRKASFLK